MFLAVTLHRTTARHRFLCQHCVMFGGALYCSGECFYSARACLVNGSQNIQACYSEADAQIVRHLRHSNSLQIRVGLRTCIFIRTIVPGGPPCGYSDLSHGHALVRNFLKNCQEPVRLLLPVCWADIAYRSLHRFASRSLLRRRVIHKIRLCFHPTHHHNSDYYRVL